MNNYSVHFFDRKNFVFALEEVLGFSDAEAIMEIREQQLPPYCAGFELWRGERLVYRGVMSCPQRAVLGLPDTLRPPEALPAVA